MTVDRYTKTVLTVIAFALVWIAAQQSVSIAIAKNEPMAIFVAQVSNDAAKCLAGHVSLFGGDTGPCIAEW
jgi:hypothetical protein